MKFGTQEWADAYIDALNGNANYKAAASWWEGDFLFIITPSGNLDHEIRMYIGLNHGDCTGAKVLDPGDSYTLLKPGEKASGSGIEVEYVFSGDYENWVKVLKQELDPIRGLLAGNFRLEGDMAKVLRATKAAQELVISTTLFDTEFY